MQKKWQRVSSKDFDVRLLMQAAREGRLYIEERESRFDKEEIIVMVRAYVRQIDMLVTRAYRDKVDDIWTRILDCDDFVELLKTGNTTRKCKNFNKYQVFRLIGILREKGIYEQYSDRKYSALLEPDSKDSPYRRYLGMGLEKRSLLVKLRKIVAEVYL